MSRKGQTVEQIFPDPRGRRAADEAVDALPLETTLRDAIHAWEAAYYDKTGTSPFRKKLN